MNLRIILLLFLLLPCLIIGQDSISILTKRLPNISPEQRLENLILLSTKLTKTDLNSAEETAKKAISLARNLNDDMAQARAAAVLGQVFTQKGNYKLAIDYFEQYLAGAERMRDTMKIANAYNRLGLVYNKMGKYDLAMYKFQGALSIWERSGEQSLVAIVLSNIGYLHLLRNDYDQAIQYFDNALEIREQLAESWRDDTEIPLKKTEDNQRRISFLFTNLGEAYAGKKEPEIALDFYKKSLVIKEDQELGISMVKTLVGIGNAYIQLGEGSKAENNYNQALHIARNQNSTSGELETLLSISKTHLELGNLDFAEKHLVQCPRLAELSRSNDLLMQVNGCFSELYAKKGDMVTAYHYEKLHSAYKDSVYTEENTKAATAAASKFNFEQEQKQNEILRQKQRFTQNVIVLLVIAAVLAFATALAVYRGLRLKKKSNYLLEKKNWEIQDKNVLLTQQGEKIQRHSDVIELHNQQLQQSNEELEQFAYIASHDLREPLRTIRSYLQLLERRYSKKMDEDARDFIQFAFEGASRMDNLLMDLLRYSRVGRDQVKKDVIYLESIVKRVKTSLAQQISENNAIINVQELPRIYGLEIEMTQVFQNMISNGIKFQKENSPIIDISCEENEDAYTLAIKDNGIGIDEQYQQKVFTIFQRLNNRTEFEGTGIGLAICSKIISNHGGKIWFESKLGQGTTFFFTLPKKGMPASVAKEMTQEITPLPVIS